MEVVTDFSRFVNVEERGIGNLVVYCQKVQGNLKEDNMDKNTPML